MIDALIKKNRSIRRFYQDKPIRIATLRNLVDLARLSPTAANIQPLKFIVSNHKEINEKIFSCLRWAGYLKDWPGPVEGEKPAAYIIIVGDKRVSKEFGCDYGIAAHSMLLGAAALRYGGCIIGSIDQERMRRLILLQKSFEILLVVALGKPKEKVVIEEARAGQSIKYYRDRKGVHHVPKRRLCDIMSVVAPKKC